MRREGVDGKCKNVGQTYRGEDDVLRERGRAGAGTTDLRAAGRTADGHLTFETDDGHQHRRETESTVWTHSRPPRGGVPRGPNRGTPRPPDAPRLQAPRSPDLQRRHQLTSIQDCWQWSETHGKRSRRCCGPFETSHRGAGHESLAAPPRANLAPPSGRCPATWRRS
jgi:hypothetical protein